MAQTILTFQLEQEKEIAVEKICQRLEIQNIEVPVKNYGQKLGYLAGITGFSKENVVYGKSPFPAEMLVFSGMDSARIDAFLAEYKKTALPAIGLKAVVTSHNIFWTAEALFTELMKEHLFYHK
ncbi:MAG: DUF3783 domain-containing protein [Lachnospiraceae bacterium]|nr:DUF3783 domain-containing protein [Lachnospiraceae bacterium]